MNILKVSEWYHGSPHKIDNWTTDFLGEGDDQEGPGIYFTSNYEDACGYMRTGNGIVHTVELRTTKWLSTTVKPKWAELVKLIEWAEDYEQILENWGEDDPASNMALVRKDYLMTNDTHFEACKSICADFYKRDAKGYASSIVALGYDGTIIKKGFMNTLHAVVWNPKIIKYV